MQRRPGETLGLTLVLFGGKKILQSSRLMRIRCNADSAGSYDTGWSKTFDYGTPRGIDHIAETAAAAAPTHSQLTISRPRPI